jgi:hypothetical protein
VVTTYARLVRSRVRETAVATHLVVFILHVSAPTIGVFVTVAGMKFILHRFHKKPYRQSSARVTFGVGLKETNRPTGASTGHKKARNELVWNVLAKLPDDDIREAVARAMPRRVGEWRGCLVRLVRSLKTIDATPTVFPYLPVLEQWHRLIPAGEVRPLWTTVRDMLADLWAETEVGECDGYMVQWCQRRVDATASHGERVRQSLVALAKLFGRKRFFLGVRTLAKCAGMSKTCAAKHLNRLLERGSIRVERRSGPHLWERMADVIHTGQLFALSDAAKTDTSGDSIPCVRTTNPVFDILNPDGEILTDDTLEIALTAPEWPKTSAEVGGWWDEDGPDDVTEPPTGRDYAPIMMRNVPVDF